MGLVDVTVYYLEMMAPPEGSAPPLRAGLSVIHARNPTARYYRFLYDTVGDDYRWYRCKRLSDEQLTELLHNPLDEVHVLHVEGTPAGFAELDCRRPGEVELLQFGLMPEFIGQGLGPWFLRKTMEIAWRRELRRYWLHTCTLDHPAALPMYQKAGFQLYKEERIQREVSLPKGSCPA
jgi:GNAT superfamily N-acetyltransferase